MAGKATTPNQTHTFKYFSQKKIPHNMPQKKQNEDRKPRLCIVLPTKNEKENIAYMIDEIRRKYDYDIIVSDEHSPDGTADIARARGVDVFPRKKPGYGHGLAESLINAKQRGNTHLLVIDCDRTYSIDGIRKLFEAAQKGYDLVNGGRRLSDIKFLHRLPNWVHTTALNILFLCNIRDVNSGMKLMNIDSYLHKITASGADSTVQIIIIARKNKFRIKEIMLPYNDRSHDKNRGKSKIKYSDGLRILNRIIWERFTR